MEIKEVDSITSYFEANQQSKTLIVQSKYAMVNT